MFNKILIILLINFIYFNNAYIYNSIVDINYQKKNLKLNSDNYLNLKNPTTKICNICKLKIDTKYYIPENCTLPIGCPFNIKTNNTKKYIFTG